MEHKDNTAISSEDCEKPTIKEECFNEVEIIKSQTTYVLQFDTSKSIPSSAVDSKVGIKQESWDANVPSTDIKFNPNQPSTCQGVDIKEEHVTPNEMSPESQVPHLQQNETYFIKYKARSVVDIKLGIKQEAWDPNEVSSEFKCNPEQPLSSDVVRFLGTGTLKAADEIDIKQELCWFERTSGDSLNEGEVRLVNINSAVSEGSDSRKNETVEDVPLLESRPPTDTVYSSSASYQLKNKETSSLSAKSNIPPHKCETKHRYKSCGKCFQFVSQLKKHTLAHKDYKWRNCDINGTNSGGLKYHQAHKCSRQNVCDTCKKSFSNLKNLKIHFLTHDDKRYYKCHVCEKSFKRLDVLKSHLLVHDDKREYKCQVCEKSFKRFRDLKAHLLIHDDKRPFKCEICEKSFKQIAVLKKHLLVHDDERHYKCPVCEKSFKRFRELQAHHFVHDDKRQFKCEICAKSFKQLPSLKRHLLIHSEKSRTSARVVQKD